MNFILYISNLYEIDLSESADWRDASIKRFQEADAELETTFQKLIADIKQKHKNDPFLNEWIDQLTVSHEAWKKFRDEALTNRWSRQEQLARFCVKTRSSSLYVPSAA